MISRAAEKHTANEIYRRRHSYIPNTQTQYTETDRLQRQMHASNTETHTEPERHSKQTARLTVRNTGSNIQTEIERQRHRQTQRDRNTER